MEDYKWSHSRPINKTVLLSSDYLHSCDAVTSTKKSIMCYKLCTLTDPSDNYTAATIQTGNNIRWSGSRRSDRGSRECQTPNELAHGPFGAPHQRPQPILEDRATLTELKCLSSETEVHSIQTSTDRSSDHRTRHSTRPLR